MTFFDHASTGNSSRVLGRDAAGMLHPLLHAHKGCLNYAKRRQYFTSQLGGSHSTSTSRKNSAFCCRAEDRNNTENKPPVSDRQDDNIKLTLAGLDALLGIDAEEVAKEAEQAKKVCPC